ncbi:MAG: amidohydrolase family protein [Treponemataceae bacterium]|nr:MAG: amidohydrolase family protein [Treponemataceae bacterium]
MFDTIITNARVVDGSGSEPFDGAIGIDKGKIVRIERGAAVTMTGAHIIDATGQYVTPGFIDMHRHEDAAVFSAGYGELQLRQGVTASINGNCGLSAVPSPQKYRADIEQYLKPIIGVLPADSKDNGKHFETFSEYLALLDAQPLPLSFGMYQGNGTLRMAVKGFASGRLSAREVQQVHRYLEDAIQNGAFGVSMGVAYVPENQYDHAGFVEALAPLRGSALPLVTHIRGEGNLLVSAVAEVIGVAEAVRVSLHISHYKCLGYKNWGRVLAEATALIDAARSRGTDVTVDVYPWTAGATQLAQVLPPEFLEGGLEAAAERLKDSAARKRCAEILKKPQTSFENQVELIGWENIMVTSVQTEKNRDCVGKKISEIAYARGSDPFDAAFDLLADERCDVSMVNFIACEEDIETIMRLPYSIIISDSIYPANGNPHPRQYGTFPKLLSEYVREKKTLTLPEAIRKITGAPAQRLSIANKGLIKEGYDADIVIFDLNKVENHADYLNPKQFGTGLSYVLVNGITAIDHDVFLHTAQGKVLRSGASVRP